MKRRLVDQLNSIYKLIISEDTECKLLGLTMLKNFPIIANKNKHWKETIELRGESRFKLYSGRNYRRITINKYTIDSLIEYFSQDKYDETYVHTLEAILIYLSESRENWKSGNRQCRYTYHGESALSKHYKGSPTMEKTYKHKKFRHKIKSKESKQLFSRRKIRIPDMTRKRFVEIKDIIPRHYITDCRQYSAGVYRRNNDPREYLISYL